MEQLKACLKELRSHVSGDVRFDEGTRSLYTVDASNYRQIPMGCVLPKSKDDIQHTLSICKKYGLPILPRGGGTSLAGQGTNAAVVLDMTRYFHGILDIDAKQRLARVLPGTVLDDLRHTANEKYQLTFAPDPATHNHCTLGGMLGNNSCGVHSVMRGMHGRTSDSTRSLEIMTYDGVKMRVGATSDAELEAIIQAGGRRGQIYRQLRSLRDRYADLIRQRYPKIPRRVSGYNLDELLPENGFQVARALVGSEGTCVTILEAELELVDFPKEKVLAVIGFDNIYEAGEAVHEILKTQPIALEGMDSKLFEYSSRSHEHKKGLHNFPDGHGWLIVEYGGDTQVEAREKAEVVHEVIKRLKGHPQLRIIQDAEQQKSIWDIRESGLGTTAFSHEIGDCWPGWEDSAVHPDRVGPYLRSLRTLMDRYDLDGAMYGHFGQGCIHSRINFDLQSVPGRETYKAFVSDAADLVVSLGGSLSGEHGDGQSRGPLLEKMFGAELVKAFEEFKRIWDPEGRMNPGKVVHSMPMDSHLKIGPAYHPRKVSTHFTYPEDNGNFSHATIRCVGVGECRREEGGTMCPSFRVTHEEKHSTRGRAHLLHEMIDGSLIKDGFQSEAVKEALDLCLACKGCKHDCPVQVDMATYKAEFLSHYHEHKRRPRQAYSMGLIHWWARLAGHVPGLVNLLGRTPGINNVMKIVAGIAKERDFPTFAPQTFREWFRTRQPKRQNTQLQVLLFPDTFNNHFEPQVARAATEVLEAAGFDVLIPPSVVCCGRPLYDHGMLDLAKKLLTHMIDQLDPYVRRNIPIVGLEPSCIAVFRDELPHLFPKDQRALLISQSMHTLGEFLAKKARSFHPPAFAKKALVHGHCHHKAIMGFDSETATMKKIGLDFDVLDSGCCGMAGSFGFEPGDKYQVSIACGEKVLLPKVREAPDSTLILADGFSCKEQIRQTTRRQGLHLAEVLHMGLRQHEMNLSAGQRPEQVYHQHFKTAPRAMVSKAMQRTVLLAAGVATVWMGWRYLKTRPREVIG